MKGSKLNNELFPIRSEIARPIDIRQTLSAYLKYWYLFLLGAILSIATAYVYLLYNTQTKYQVVSRLLIKDTNRGAEVASANTFSDIEILNTTKNTDNERLILESKTLMRRVVNDLNLSIKYYIDDQFRDKELYGHELPIKIIASKLQDKAYNKEITLHIKDNTTFDLEDNDGNISKHEFGQTIRKPYATFTIVTISNLNTTTLSPNLKDIKIKFRDFRNVADHYHNSISITQETKNASILNLELIDTKPERAKDILNRLIELYNQDATEDKNSIATNTLNFIDERLKYLTNELSGVEKNVEKYKSANEVTDVTSQATDYMAQANDYNKQLSDWAIQIDVLRSLEKYIRHNKNDQLVPSTLGIQDQTLVVLIDKFNELQLDRERMLRTANPNSPLIQNINEQLTNLRTNILENLSNIKRSLTITSDKLKAASIQFKSKIKKVPSMERNLLEINRQQSIKQNLYLYLLQKREETALSLAASISHTRIIDSAMIEGYYTTPNMSTIYLMSLLIGLGVPFAALYLINLFKDKVQDRSEVEYMTKTPLLGELCHHEGTETLVITKGSRTPIAEMIRHIRAKLHFAAIDKENKVMLIASSMSGEGKTFFGINLAASLVLTEKKTLIIDLDLRKPHLSHELGLTSQLGISNFIASEDLTIQEIIRPSESIPNLYVIPSGPIPPDPAEMMTSKKLIYLINELREIFDYIIIDTPPIGQVADALSLSALVDSTIFIIRYNYTRKKQIEIIDDVYRNKILPHPMIILNDSKETRGYGYGYEYINHKTSKNKVSI